MKKSIAIASLVCTSLTIGWFASYYYWMDVAILPTHIQYLVIPDNDSLKLGSTLKVTENTPDHIKIILK